MMFVKIALQNWEKFHNHCWKIDILLYHFLHICMHTGKKELISFCTCIIIIITTNRVVYKYIV